MKTLASFKRECVGRVAKVVKDEMYFNTDQKRLVNGEIVVIPAKQWIDYSARHKMLNTPRKIVAANSVGIQFLQPNGTDKSYLGIEKASDYKPTENGFVIETHHDVGGHRIVYEFCN